LKFLEKEEYLMFISNSVNYSKLKLLMNRFDLYNFQIKNSSFDPLVKTILRSYSGTFDDYITIQESDIARRSEKTQDDIKKQLNYLQKLKVLQYIPKSFLPKIIFIRERIDVKKLTISTENYSKRKENDLQKLDEVIHYASSSFFCRSQLLLHYFGQKDMKACGNCDVCLTKKKREKLRQDDFDQLKNKIKEILIQNQMSINELMDQINPENENETMMGIRLLIDNEILIYKDETLTWKG
jgi:ATP-dependent DNA helicase RecQ